MERAGKDPRARPAVIAARAKEMLLMEPGLKLALLHGSVATGRMRAGSDVDLAVLFDHPLTADEKVDLTSRLELGLLRTVDLVDLFALNGTILKQVLCGGKVLVRQRQEDMAALVGRMIYNQADVMPYVRRTLIERQKRFAHG